MQFVFLDLSDSFQSELGSNLASKYWEFRVEYAWLRDEAFQTSLPLPLGWRDYFLLRPGLHLGAIRQTFEHRRLLRSNFLTVCVYRHALRRLNPLLFNDLILAVNWHERCVQKGALS